MSNKRTHFVTTSDAVTIGATVTGQGPSLVFLHGIIGDGDLDWHTVLPHLTGRFTCHRQRHSLTGTRRGSECVKPPTAPGATWVTSPPPSLARRQWSADLRMRRRCMRGRMCRA